MLYVSQASSYDFNGEFLYLYCPPVLLTTAVYFYVLYIFKTWTCERKDFIDLKEGKSNSQRRRTSGFHVPRKKFHSQYSARSGSRLRRSRRRKEKRDKVVQINFEEEFSKPYCQALKTLYSEEQIKKAMVYMNKTGNFVDQRKTAEIVGKNVEHIKNIEKWEKDFRVERDPGAQFPKEPTRKDLEDDLLQFNSWDHGEIGLLLNQTYAKYGFYPTATEFCEIYESQKGKLDELFMTRRKLRKVVGTLKKENISLKKACIEHDDLRRVHDDLKSMLQELQRTNSSLEQRHFCKICCVNEMNIVVFPCKHMYSCQDCFQRQDQKCLLCLKSVKQFEKILLG